MVVICLFNINDLLFNMLDANCSFIINNYFFVLTKYKYTSHLANNISELLMAIIYSLLELLNIFSWFFNNGRFPNDDDDDENQDNINYLKEGIQNKGTDSNKHDIITDVAYSNNNDDFSEEDKNLWKLIDLNTDIKTTDITDKYDLFQSNIEKANTNTDDEHWLEKWDRENEVPINKWMFSVMLGCVCIALFRGS